MTRPIAFHDDHTLKNQILNRIHAHEQYDRLARGIYWDGYKGCAVGCTLYDIYSPEPPYTLPGYKLHSLYESLLGIPSWLARLEDHIFEGLSSSEALGKKYDPEGVQLEEDTQVFIRQIPSWPRRFIGAIPVGMDRWYTLDTLLTTRRLAEESAVLSEYWSPKTRDTVINHIGGPVPTPDLPKSAIYILESVYQDSVDSASTIVEAVVHEMRRNKPPLQAEEEAWSREANRIETILGSF